MEIGDPPAANATLGDSIVSRQGEHLIWLWDFEILNFKGPKLGCILDSWFCLVEYPCNLEAIVPWNTRAKPERSCISDEAKDIIPQWKSRQHWWEPGFNGLFSGILGFKVSTKCAWAFGGPQNSHVHPDCVINNHYGFRHKKPNKRLFDIALQWNKPVLGGYLFFRYIPGGLVGDYQ